MRHTLSKYLPFNLERGFSDLHLPRILALATKQVWPYLKSAGLPKYIVENPKVMPPVYERFRHGYCIAFSSMSENPALVQEIMGKEYHWADYEKWARIKLWHSLLEHLTELSDRDVAVEFDRWAHRHWFPDEQLDRATDEWQRLLECMTDPTAEGIKVPIPNFLEPLIPDLRELVSYEITYDVIGEDDFEPIPDKMAGEAELLTPNGMSIIVGSGLTIKLYDQWSYDNGQIRTSQSIPPDYFESHYEPPCLYTLAPRPNFTAFTEAIVKEGVFQALSLLATHLSSPQKKEFTEWAEKQVIATGFGSNINYLYGETYLTVKPPFHDLPSILDMKDTGFPHFWSNLSWS
jgi:hypothetical protein